MSRHFAGIRHPMVFLILAACSPALVGQAAAGSLEGEITASDGGSLPGAQVTVSSPALSQPQSVVTGSDGRYVVPNLPAGNYTVKVELEGFESVTRTATLDDAETQTLFFVLQGSSLGEDVFVIDSIQSAAANIPQFHANSGSAPGSLVAGFVRGVDFGPLAQAQTVPLDDELGPFSASIDANGQTFRTYPVFTVNQQFVVVIDSDTPVGTWPMTFTFDGVESRPFMIHIVAAAPGFFTWEGSGFGQLIVTRPDFSLVDKVHPLQPGDPFIVWGEGGGRAPIDFEGVVFDKRDGYDSFQAFLGGAELTDIFYYGSAGGYAGGDQFIGTVPPIFDRFGCAVPFYLHIETGGHSALSNVGSIPVSADGLPCSDPFGLDAGEVAQLGGGYRVAQFNWSEVTLISPDDTRHLLEITANARALNELTYRASPPPGNCIYRWFAPDSQLPSQPIQMQGAVGVNLPWTVFDLVSNSQYGPYRQVYSRPANLATMRSGPYIIDWDSTFDGDALRPPNLGGNYDRADFTTWDPLIEDMRVGEYAQHGYVTPEALGYGNSFPDPYAFYGLDLDSGPRGRDRVECTMRADRPEDTAAIEEAFRVFLGLLPDWFESGQIILGLRPPGEEFPVPAGGPLDLVEHNFTGSAFFELDNENLAEFYEALLAR